MFRFLSPLLALAALCALPAAARTTLPYANLPGWTVVVNQGSDGYVSCSARYATGPGTLEIEARRGKWRLQVPSFHDDGTTTGRLILDSAKFNVDLISNNGTATLTLPDGLAASLATAASVAVKQDGFDKITWFLKGNSAAISTLAECDRRQGRPGTAANPKPPESDAARLGGGCPAWGKERSPASNQPATAKFANKSDRALTVYWLGFDGSVQGYAGLVPGESTEIPSFVGHKWIAKDFTGSCVGGVMVVQPGENRFRLK